MPIRWEQLHPINVLAVRLLAAADFFSRGMLKQRIFSNSLIDFRVIY